MYNKAGMALIYFYDSTPTDENHLNEALAETDHQWKFVDEKISLENLDPEAEVVSIFVTSTITAEMIDHMPKLRAIACRSTGFNNVDLEHARSRGITVLNVPTYGEQTVAEYAFTLLLALVKKLPQTLSSHGVDKNQDALLGFDLSGKTLGVIGTGHIGQHTIQIANGFGMKTIAYDAFPRQELEAQLHFSYATLEEVLKTADIISLHAPYLPATHHILNEERMSMMKKGSVIINTARGELVDTKALIKHLADKHIGGAGLDVVEGEELLHYDEEIALLRSEHLPDSVLEQSINISVLRKMPNVIITPHNAFNTYEAVKRINSTTAQNIIDFWYNKTPNAVKPPKKTMGKLIIVRHAESEWNATGKWTGITDVHLSEKGFHESALLGQLLKKIGLHVDIAYCSEQIRTRETLEGILDASQQFDVDIVRHNAINERDYGDYTGKNKWEIKEQLGEQAFNDLRRGWNAPVPNGETLKMVYERAVPFYKEVLLQTLQAGRNVLLVAHGNSIRALMKYIENISDDDVAELEMIFGQIVTYDVDEDGRILKKSTDAIDSTPPKA